MSKEDKVYWLESAILNKPFERTTWYRCVGIEEFIKKVEETNVIVGVIVSDNNIGFILDEKH